MHTEVRASLRGTALPALLALIALLFPGPSAAGQLDGGSIEVCAAADLGPVGTPLQLAVNGGAPVSLRIGRCTGAWAIPAGPATVELLGRPPAGAVDVRPVARRLALDAAAGRVTAAVPGGSTAATRTIVTFAATEAGLPVSAHGPGLIDVCASAENGMVDRPFQFSLNGGPGFTLVGGSCSGPLTTRSGTNLVTMLASAVGQAAEITVAPAARLLSSDVGAQRVTALVPASLEPGARTTITFVNAPPGTLGGPGAGTGELKVCKTSRTPAFQGRLFSFSLNAGPAFSIEAGTPQAPVCSSPVAYPLGTRVVVQELAMPNVVVEAIGVSDGRGSGADLAARSVTATVGTGATVVTFANEPAPLPQTGYVEVCKDAEGPDVAGQFDFTVSAPGFTQAATAYVGQCTGPIEVPAGYVTIEEAARSGFELYTVSALPATRLVSANLINRTMTVEVPVGDPTTETQVHFVNRAIRGQLKVCKTLAPGSDALSGRTFMFDVTRRADSTTAGPVSRVRVQAQASTTQCVIAGSYPVGEAVKVDEVFAEELPAGDPDLGVAQPGAWIDVSGEATVTIAAGVNSVTVTNRAVGLLTLCKAAVPGLTAQPSFRFRVDGGGVITVRAGSCTLPLRVSVGAHSAVEIAENDFELDPAAPGGGLDVYPANRELSRNPGLRTLSATVPYGEAGETRVLFVNRVKLGAVKVCKQVPAGSQDALGAQAFAFSVTVAGVAHRVESLRPGECSAPLPSAPVLRPDGSPALVTVTEDGAGPAAGFDVQGIGCSGCRGPVTTDLAAGELRFALAPGTNVVTYTNAVHP